MKQLEKLRMYKGTANEDGNQQNRLSTTQQQRSGLFQSARSLNRRQSCAKENLVVQIQSSPPPATRLLKKPMSNGQRSKMAGISQPSRPTLSIRNEDARLGQSSFAARPYSQQQSWNPWQSKTVDESSESCPNELGFTDEEDSCEANADERESIVEMGDTNVFAKPRVSQQRWDHFPELEESDFEDDFYIIADVEKKPRGTQNGKGKTKIADLRSYERPASINTAVRKQRSQVQLAGPPKDVSFSPRQARAAVKSMYYQRSDNKAKICELLRSKQSQPSFVKQNSKGSLDLNRQNEPPRNSYCSPMQFRVAPIFDNDPRTENKRLTVDNTMRETFANNRRRTTLVHKNSFVLQDERHFENRKRLSVQKIPLSMLSQHSLMGVGEARYNSRSRFSPSPTNQQQANQQIMAERTNFKYVPQKQQNVSGRPHYNEKKLILPGDNQSQQLRGVPDVVYNDTDDGDIIQVEQNYFDHIQLPSQTSDQVATSGAIARRDYKTYRAREESKGEPSSHMKKQHSNLQNINETMSAQQRQQLATGRTRMQEFSPTGVIPADDSPLRNVTGTARAVYQLKTNMRQSQETEQRSNVQDGSQRNLFGSFINCDSKKISFVGDGISEEEDGSALVRTAEKPIVPKHEYIQSPQEDKMVRNVVAAKESTQEDQNVGWFTSLSLSVSQMFTGGYQAPAPEDEESDEKRQRRPSSNGEVPDDDEDENSLKQEEQKNNNVMQEETRVQGGGGKSVHRKILFMENGVKTNKKSTGGSNMDQASQKKTLKSVQSYVPCESDSSKTEEDDLAFAANKSKIGENVISFTTSKNENDSPQERTKTINAINKSQNFKKQRQHSSSVHEQMSFGGSIKQGWSNLTTSLLQSRLMEGRGAADQRGLDDPSLVSPMPKGVPSGDNLEKSNFGVFGRFFERVTNTTQKDLAKSQRMSINKHDTADKSEDYFSPVSNDHSPLIAGIKDFSQKESYSVKRELFKRHASKTVYEASDQRPRILSHGPAGTQKPNRGFSCPEEKLKQISKITFNQDRSHFAVIWTDGGFSKFDVATLQLVQTVHHLPPAEHCHSQSQDEIEITLVTTDPERVKTLGNIQLSEKVSRKRNFDGGDVQDDDFFFFDDEEDIPDSSELDKFQCLALQHRTSDYLATVTRNPNVVISVHIKDETIANIKKRKRAKRANPNQIGQRTQVKHFSEEVTQIQILPGARYTVICLKSKIYIYSKNSSALYDIIDCSHPAISSAIYKSFEDKLVLAYLSKEDPGETLLVHDYTISPSNGMDTIFQIAKPFSSGYKVGGVQLDKLGQRVCVVSADGRFVYLYKLEEEQQSDQISQDMAKPEDGVSSSDAVSQDIHHSAAVGLQHHEVVIKAPQQQFARSTSSSKEIYAPIQIVEGFSIQDHQTDYILLSTCSMTTHMFALKTEEELAESQSQQKESWTFASLLPQSYTLERSKIRLNIQEELAPPQPFKPNNAKGDSAQQPGQHPEIEGENVYKKLLHEYPYTCFVESSGLLVVISFSGYCCKFSIDFQNEELRLHPRYSGFNSVRANRLSPTRQGGPVYLADQKNLSQSLAIVTDQASLHRAATQTARNRSPGGANKSAFATADPNTNTGDVGGKRQRNTMVDDPDKIHIPDLQVAAPQTAKGQKKATAFSGYKNPTMRLKFKIKEFFISIDQKAASLKRIHKREILSKYNEKMRERAQFIAKLQKDQKLLQQMKAREEKVSQLRRLLSTGSSKLPHQN